MKIFQNVRFSYYRNLEFFKMLDFYSMKIGIFKSQFLIIHFPDKYFFIYLSLIKF